MPNSRQWVERRETELSGKVIARGLIYESQEWVPLTADFHAQRQLLPAFRLLVGFPSKYAGFPQGAAERSSNLRMPETNRSDPLEYVFPVPSSFHATSFNCFPAFCFSSLSKYSREIDHLKASNPPQLTSLKVFWTIGSTG
jgi:hypothetical protein